MQCVTRSCILDSNCICPSVRPYKYSLKGYFVGTHGLKLCADFNRHYK
jgi:hypothetical protein